MLWLEIAWTNRYMRAKIRIFFFKKMAASGHLGYRNAPKNKLGRDFTLTNAHTKYEINRLIFVTCRAHTRKCLRTRRRTRRMRWRNARWSIVSPDFRSGDTMSMIHDAIPDSGRESQHRVPGYRGSIHKEQWITIERPLKPRYYQPGQLDLVTRYWNKVIKPVGPWDLL